MARDKNMRKVVRPFPGLGVFIALVSPAIAELAMTGAPVTMRVGPTGKAGIVQRLPQNADINVGKCAHGWCHVLRRGRFGYVPPEAVVLGSSPTTLLGDKMPPPVVNAPPTDAPRPAWRWTGPYVGVNGGFASGSW